MDGSLHPLQLIHQGLIHMEPAGGVQEDHITAVVPGMADCILCNLHRVTLTLLEYRQVQLATHHLQLLDGGGTVHVAGGQQEVTPTEGQALDRRSTQRTYDS